MRHQDSLLRHSHLRLCSLHLNIRVLSTTLKLHLMMSCILNTTMISLSTTALTRRGCLSLCWMSRMATEFMTRMASQWTQLLWTAKIYILKKTPCLIAESRMQHLLRSSGLKRKMWWRRSRSSKSVLELETHLKFQLDYLNRPCINLSNCRRHLLHFYHLSIILVLSTRFQSSHLQGLLTKFAAQVKRKENLSLITWGQGNLWPLQLILGGATTTRRQ